MHIYECSHVPVKDLWVDHIAHLRMPGHFMPMLSIRVTLFMSVPSKIDLGNYRLTN